MSERAKRRIQECLQSSLKLSISSRGAKSGSLLSGFCFSCLLLLNNSRYTYTTERASQGPARVSVLLATLDMPSFAAPGPDVPRTCIPRPGPDAAQARPPGFRFGCGLGSDPKLGPGPAFLPGGADLPAKDAEAGHVTEVNHFLSGLCIYPPLSHACDARQLQNKSKTSRDKDYSWVLRQAAAHRAKPMLAASCHPSRGPLREHGGSPAPATLR